MVAATEMTPMMPAGARLKGMPNVSTPEAIGDAPLHAWKYTGLKCGEKELAAGHALKLGLDVQMRASEAIGMIKVWTKPLRPR